VSDRTLENRKKREKKKNRKLRKQESAAVERSDVPEWRRGAGSQFKGFFSECSPEVQKELRETRAQVLVAKNRAAVAREEARAKQLASPEAVVRDALRVMKLAGQVKSVGKDHAIGGWARTVVEGCAASIAASAPSSVPSLESVGLTPPVDEAQSAASLRLAEYEARRAALEDEFAALPYHALSDYEAACQGLKGEYADVCFTDVERIEQAASGVRERLVFDMLDTLQSLDTGLTVQEFKKHAIGAVVRMAG